MILSPIHTGTVNGAPVRFFVNSLIDETPWASWDDLAQALFMPEKWKQGFAEATRAQWPDAFQTIATPDGITTIIPAAAAAGMLDGIEDVMHITGLAAEYRASATAATRGM